MEAFESSQEQLDTPHTAAWKGSQDLEQAGAEEVIRRTLERWHPRVAVVIAFQIEGMAILDMAWRIQPEVRVITLDTGRLPTESYDLMQKVRERYGIEVEVFFPDAQKVETMVRRSGPNLFYESVEGRKECCRVRKVQVLQRALSGLDAWVTGLRRDQAPGRAGIRKIEKDEANGGLVKVSPLADWTQEQVWEYIRERQVPYHPLYDRGYTSIGCAPCTRAIQPGEDPRAGRWWWESEDAKECGLHVIQGPHGPQLVRGELDGGRS